MIRHWPIVATVCLLWVAVGILVCLTVAQNDHHLVYPLDDTYITMAMAKNLAEHGVWGVTRYEFASSSSSILWPIVIAATHRILGSSETAPLAWNLVCATLMVGYCGVQLGNRGLRSLPLFIALVGLVLLIPLPVLVFIGLEHTLHLLLTLAVVTRAVGELGETRPSIATYPSRWLLTLTSLLVATRYEGLFLVMMLCLVWAAGRKWRGVAALAAAASVPVIAYGVVSAAHGWHFFPNSILLKGSMTQALRSIVQQGPFSAHGVAGFVDLIGLGAYERFMKAPAVLFLLLAILALELCRSENRWSPSNPRSVLVVLCGGTNLLHMQFAGVGWLFRYEAYLVGLGLFALLILAREWAAGSGWTRDLRAGAMLCFVGWLCLWALGSRAAQALATAPQAARNIYEQQYQMGLFVKEHFQGSKVTLSDVGAVNYLADVRCLDVDGLATRETFDLKLTGALTRDAIASLSRDSSLAIPYDRVFAARGLPPGWRKVGSWTIPNNVICGDDTVIFYSTEVSDEGDLVSKLRQFGSRLPSDVEQFIVEAPRKSP